jgi:hypothetical protein
VDGLKFYGMVDVECDYVMIFFPDVFIARMCLFVLTAPQFFIDVATALDLSNGKIQTLFASASNVHAKYSYSTSGSSYTPSHSVRL